MNMRIAILGASLVLGCGSPSSKQAQPPEYAPKGETKCSVMKSQSSPLIVEWPSAERARLESMTKDGLVAVRYEGCEMQALPGCHINAKYRYVALTPKYDRMRIRSQDELYASMPIHAASFEGKLEQAGELNVSMTIVGRFEAETHMFDRESLHGDCKDATHVVSAITAGAFRFFAGAEAERSGGVEVLGVGAGAKSSSRHETLAEDGDEQACKSSNETDSAPPFACGALIRLEVTPISVGRVQPSPAAPRVVDKPRAARKGTPTKSTAPLPSLPPGSRYTIASDTVVDSTTHLTWQRMPDNDGVTWENAIAFCTGLELAGAKGFRLPTSDELLTLGENLPAGINRNAFPAATDHERSTASELVFYWTATQHPVAETMAWSVRFGVMGAQKVLQSKRSAHHVRCVR